MQGLLHRLRASTAGIAATEFAFVAPVFIYMTFAAIDFGYVQYAQSKLQGGTQIAARQIIVKAGTEAEKKDAAKAKITQHMGGLPLVSGQQMTVNFKKFGGFGRNPEPYDVDGPDGNQPTDNNGRWDPGETYTDLNGNGKYDDNLPSDNALGGVGDVVQIDVTYPLKPLSVGSPMLTFFQRLDIKATSVVRNEPE